MVAQSTALSVYLVVVLAVAAAATIGALGTLTAAVVRNRRIRLAHHLSLRAYYCPRPALHH